MKQDNKQRDDATTPRRAKSKKNRTFYGKNYTKALKNDGISNKRRTDKKAALKVDNTTKIALEYIAYQFYGLVCHIPKIYIGQTTSSNGDTVYSIMTSEEEGYQDLIDFLEITPENFSNPDSLNKARAKFSKIPGINRACLLAMAALLMDYDFLGRGLRNAGVAPTPEDNSHEIVKIDPGAADLLGSYQLYAKFIEAKDNLILEQFKSLAYVGEGPMLFFGMSEEEQLSNGISKEDRLLAIKAITRISDQLIMNIVNQEAMKRLLSDDIRVLIINNMKARRNAILVTYLNDLENYKNRSISLNELEIRSANKIFKNITEFEEVDGEHNGRYGFTVPKRYHKRFKFQKSPSRQILLSENVTAANLQRQSSATSLVSPKKTQTPSRQNSEDPISYQTPTKILQRQPSSVSPAKRSPLQHNASVSSLTNKLNLSPLGSPTKPKPAKTPGYVMALKELISSESKIIEIVKAFLDTLEEWKIVLDPESHAVLLEIAAALKKLPDKNIFESLIDGEVTVENFRKIIFSLEAIFQSGMFIAKNIKFLQDISFDYSYYQKKLSKNQQKIKEAYNNLNAGNRLKAVVDESVLGDLFGFIANTGAACLQRLSRYSVLFKELHEQAKKSLNDDSELIDALKRMEETIALSNEQADAKLKHTPRDYLIARILQAINFYLNTVPGQDNTDPANLCMGWKEEAQVIAHLVEKAYGKNTDINIVATEVGHIVKSIKHRFSGRHSRLVGTLERILIENGGVSKEEFPEEDFNEAVLPINKLPAILPSQAEAYIQKHIINQLLLRIDACSKSLPTFQARVLKKLEDGLKLLQNSQKKFTPETFQSAVVNCLREHLIIVGDFPAVFLKGNFGYTLKSILELLDPIFAGENRSKRPITQHLFLERINVWQKADKNIESKFDINSTTLCSAVQRIRDYYAQTGLGKQLTAELGIRPCNAKFSCVKQLEELEKVITQIYFADQSQEEQKQEAMLQIIEAKVLNLKADKVLTSLLQSLVKLYRGEKCDSNVDNQLSVTSLISASTENAKQYIRQHVIQQAHAPFLKYLTNADQRIFTRTAPKKYESAFVISAAFGEQLISSEATDIPENLSAIQSKHYSAGYQPKILGEGKLKQAAEYSEKYIASLQIKPKRA